MICLSKEEAGELLDHRVNVLASKQELRHSTRIFAKLAGNPLFEEIPLYLLMAMWTHHIDRFEQKYDKAFAKYPLFGADMIYRIHKRVQVFIHSCNITSI